MEMSSKHYLEDSDEDDEVPLPKKSKIFLSKWLNYPLFKNWVRPHADRTKAYCFACDCTLVAGASELSKHAQTLKHEKAMCSMLEDNEAIPIIKIENNELANQPEEIQNGTDGEEIGDDIPQVAEEQVTEYNVVGDSNTSRSDSDTERYVDDGEQHVDSTLSNHILGENETASISRPAPFWESPAIVNGHIAELKLTDYRGHYLILFFYPQDFSESCASDIMKISDKIATFRAVNTEVIACSVDSCLAHRAWVRMPRNEGGISQVKIPLLSDQTHAISRRYGCYLSDTGYAMRAYYIIDPRGIVRHITVNDPEITCSTESMLKTIYKLQNVN